MNTRWKSVGYNFLPCFLYKTASKSPGKYVYITKLDVISNTRILRIFMIFNFKFIQYN